MKVRDLLWAVLIIWHPLAVAQEPATLQVVVKVHPQRIITPSFVHSLHDQLTQGLSTALAGLGPVRVILFDAEPSDRRLPAWTQAFASGLERLERIDRPGPWKTHFVEVEIHGGVYRIRSRQLDGSFGWCSPVVRIDDTVDREIVPRLIVAQILRDYGLTGALVGTDGEKVATLRFNGNWNDQTWREWIKIGDVFTVVQPMRAGRSIEIPHTYLTVAKEPSNGQVECQVHSRFVKPLASGRFEAIKLGTEHGPVRLRVVGAGGAALPEIVVRLSATGLDKADAVREQSTARYGRFKSSEQYDRLAFARLQTGDRLLAQVPIPVLSGDPLLVEVSADPGRETAISTEAEVRGLRNRAYDELARCSADDEQVRRLIVERKNKQALGVAIVGLRRLDEELIHLAGDVAAVHAKPGVLTADRDDLDRFVRDLKTYQKALKAAKTNLEGALDAARSPEADRQREALRALLAQAESEAAAGDFDKAIATYEALLKQSGEWPDAQKKLEELRRGWAIKSDAHKAARAFLYQTFARSATTEEIEKQLDGARRSFNTCKEVGDRLTPRKLYLTLVQAASIISTRDEELRKSDAEDIAKQIEGIRRLRDRVRSLLNEVEAYLRTAE